MSWIKEGAKLLLITICLFLVVDLITTGLYGNRGFSQFFVSSNIEGRHNKPNFSGGFGGILDEFNGQVNIGSSGERLSDPVSCENVVSKVLFIGDSTTAGFEVDDKETFISHFNKQCFTTKRSGTNFGVRAHDTHAVIGTYERVSSQFRHDYVVYFMTSNDFEENMQSNAYVNMTKRFGRRFEGKFIKPVDSLIWSTYASLRLFVSDRLALTTYLIKVIEIQMKASSEFLPKPTKDLEAQAQKAFELIKKLSTMVKANGAKLIITPYPRLRLEKDYNRNKQVEILSKLIGKNLGGVLYIDNIDSLVNKKIHMDGKQLSEMRFRNDGHLSSYGHKIISQVLLDVFQDLNTSSK